MDEKADDTERGNDGESETGGDGVNSAPESIIAAPLAVMTIGQGQSLSFAGECSDPDGDTRLSYAWDFDGIIDASTEKVPGEVQFDLLGRYTITFTCSDSEGLADSSPASVLVVVRNRILVTTTNDEINDDEECSLREAIQAANTDTEVSGCGPGSGWDLIEVPEGRYLLELAGDEDLNAGGDLDIFESVTLVGADSSKTSIDGNTADRLFHIHPADPGIQVELSGFELTHGAALTGAALRLESGQLIVRESLLNENRATHSGGAIQIVAGSVALHSVTLSENQVIDPAEGYGGAIYNQAGILRVSDSLISNNTAYDGAGIYSAQGSVWLSATQVLRNVNPTDDRETRGGGIYIDHGSLHLENDSEIAEHLSVDEGAGLYLSENSLFTMNDSSIHDNQAASAGGGIYGLMKAAWIRRSSIHHNQVRSVGMPVSDEDEPARVGPGSRPRPGEGGGIYLEDADLIFEESELMQNEAGEGG